MRHLKILPIIAIALLAACKSTVPQSQSLLEEHISSAGEISSSSDEIAKSKYANPKDYEKRLYEASNQILKGVNDMPFRDNYAARGASSCNAMLDGDNLQLHVVTAEKKGNFLMTISNGIASCQEEYMDHNEKQLAKICNEIQRDTTKSNVKCADNIITYIFNKRFDDIDNNDLLDQINYSICPDLMRQFTLYLAYKIYYDLEEKLQRDWEHPSGPCPCGVYIDALSCDIQLNKETIKLKTLTVYQKEEIELTISKGNAIMQEYLKGFDNAEISKICSNYKSDSTKSHVECSDNIITHSLNYDFNNIDIHYMNKELKMFCDDFTSTAITPCNLNCKTWSNETPSPSLIDDDL